METADRLIASKWPAAYFALKFHRNKRNQPMDLFTRPFLQDIYRDDHQNIAVMKCVQVGISEWLLCVLLSKAYMGWSVLYSLPTEGLRNDFVADRLDKLFKYVPFYRQGLKAVKDNTDKVGMKHIWNGTAWFVGSNSSVAFLSRDADFVIIDELDKSLIDNIRFAPDRLKASEYKYFWKVGNPTFTKHGIHKEYVDSDQKQWRIKCSHCNHVQPIELFKNIVNQIGENEYELIDRNWESNSGRDIFVYCNKCGLLVDRLQPGRWIAKCPDRDVSGYHISQLFSPTVTIKEIYEQFLKGLINSTEMQVLYNSCLGLPYEGAGDKLTAALLDSKCMVVDYLMPSMSDNKCTAGIDVNWPELNVRISDYSTGKRRAVYIGSVLEFDKLDELLKRYNVKHAVIDIAPERHKVAEYQKQNPNLWACQYTGTPNPDNLETSIRKAESNFRSNAIKKITVDRTQVIDAMVSNIISGNNQLPKNFRSIDDNKYIDQIEAPSRIKDETRKPPRYVWAEGNDPDHYFHAEVYDYLAMKIRNVIGDMSPRHFTIEDIEDDEQS